MFRKVREEIAQGHTEYALLLAAVALFLIFMLLYFGESLVGTYQWIIDQLPL